MNLWLVRDGKATRHGPTDAAIPVDHVRREVLLVAARIDAGRFRPQSPFDLSYRITSATASRQEAPVSDLATEVSTLETRRLLHRLAGIVPDTGCREACQRRARGGGMKGMRRTV